MNKVTGGWKALELGARNGVIFGALFELANRLYYQWSVSPTGVYPERCCPSMIGYRFAWWYIPLVSVVFASPASVLVHHLLSRRIKSIILLWQIIGFVALFGFSIYRWGSIAYRLHTQSLLSDYIGMLIDIEVKLILFIVLPLVVGYNLIFAVLLRKSRRASLDSAG